MCCYDHEQFQVDDVLTLPSDVFSDVSFKKENIKYSEL